MAKDKRYHTTLWRTLREEVFTRDGYTCQLRGKTCNGKAQQVDHIVRPADGGEFFELGNLRASCAPCNAARGGAEGAKMTNAPKYPPALEW